MIPPGEESPSNEVSAKTAAAPSGSRWLWVLVAMVFALLAYPILQMVTKNTAPPKLPDGAQALLNVSFQLFQAGRYQEAIGAASAVLKMVPNSADAYNNIAVSYAALKNWDEAVKNVQEALRIRPDYQLARNNLAWFIKERVKANGATAPEGPKSLKYYLSLSLSECRAGRNQECVDASKAALELDANSAIAYNNLAVGYAGLGAWDDAVIAARNAVRIDPGMQLAQNNLAWVSGEQAKAHAKQSK
jgi:tetratricopeptide (TPR) repeat protein